MSHHLLNLIGRSGASHLLFIALPFLLTTQGCNDTSLDASVEVAGMKYSTETTQPNATNSKTLFAEIDGRKIAYRSIGSGEPMILCQRFRGNLDDWDPEFLDVLAKTFNVITFDYTGFASSTGTAPADMKTFAKDVIDLAKALELEQFIMGGWSFGGMVAQIVTAEFPEKVTHTVLIGTGPPGIVSHPPEPIFFERALKPVNDLDDIVILFFEPTSEISRAAALQSYKRITKRTTDKDIPVKEELWQNYFNGGEDYRNDPYGARQKLMTSSIPILVITGDHEISFPVENWFELNRKLPTVQMMVFPQSGHGPHHQYPELIGDYITDFIRENERI